MCRTYFSTLFFLHFHVRMPVIGKKMFFGCMHGSLYRSGIDVFWTIAQRPTLKKATQDREIRIRQIKRQREKKNLIDVNLLIRGLLLKTIYYRPSSSYSLSNVDYFKDSTFLHLYFNKDDSVRVIEFSTILYGQQ